MTQPPHRDKAISPLKKWHSRLGLTAAIFVLALALTGFLLNHVADWRLDDRLISSPLVLEWYGISQPHQMRSFAVAEQFISKVGEEVFLNTREVAHCSGELRGAVALLSGKMLVIACENELFLLDQNHEMIERLGISQGLPSPLRRIGIHNTELVLAIGSDSHPDVMGADVDNLLWTPLSGDAGAVLWSVSVPTPPALADLLGKHFVGEGISVERLLLDIHSGRIVGGWGVYMVDLMAILFVVLAVTGCLLWYRQGRQQG
tara:strand:+ start:5101 stop:5880 length:780 start_codon:yes stop_codon:yes gene_type:complete